MSTRIRQARFLSVLFLLVSIVLSIEIQPTTSSYSYFLDVLDCDNLNYMSGCRHEIGHKMDADLGMPSLSPEFGQAMQMYILVELKKPVPSLLSMILLTHPGVYTNDPTHPLQIQRELYASIYAWSDGDVSQIPDGLRPFFSTDETYQDLYSCLSGEGLNLCDWTNVSYIRN